MPTYQYACTECGEQLEVVQKFTDDPLTTCPACGGRLRKVFSPVGVLFKGSGFYRTDSRTTERAGEPAKEPAKADSAAASSTTSAKDSSASKTASSKTSESAA